MTGLGKRRFAMLLCVGGKYFSGTTAQVDGLPNAEIVEVDFWNLFHFFKLHTPLSCGYVDGDLKFLGRGMTELNDMADKVGSLRDLCLRYRIVMVHPKTPAEWGVAREDIEKCPNLEQVFEMICSVSRDKWF